MMKIMVWLETQSGIHVCIFSNSMNMVREAEMNCVPVDSGCILYVDENCIVLLPCSHLTMCKSRVIKQRTVWQAQLVAGEGMIERASWTLTVEQTKDWGCRLSSMSLVPVTELGVIYSDTQWYTVCGGMSTSLEADEISTSTGLGLSAESGCWGRNLSAYGMFHMQWGCDNELNKCDSSITCTVCVQSTIDIQQ